MRRLQQLPSVAAQAVLAHRVAHALHRRGVRFVPLLISAAARTLTGVEIHPGAQIGRRLRVVHGAGVVIGETAVVGDDVTLHGDVTLGSTGYAIGKRHPTVEDGAELEQGAKVIGAVRVGRDSTVGANAVVTREVAAHASVGGCPVPADHPYLRALSDLERRLGCLEREVAEFVASRDPARADAAYAGAERG
jgi:serine O-acetyltransferase